MPWVRLSFTYPLRRFRQDCEELSSLNAKEHPTQADLGRMDALDHGYGQLLLEGGKNTRDAFQKDRALLRGTRILLQLRAKRLGEGTYPATLDGLDAPPDPFSGKPFVYRKLAGDAFQLYSVGLNGKDDGGLIDYRGASNSPGGGGDILFGRPPTP